MECKIEVRPARTYLQQLCTETGSSISRRICWMKQMIEANGDVESWHNMIYIYIYIYGWAKVERPDRTYIQELCADTWCNLEDLPGVTDDRDGWWERVREFRASSVTWWWRWNKRIQAKPNPSPRDYYLWGSLRAQDFKGSLEIYPLVITSSGDTWRLMSLNVGRRSNPLWLLPQEIAQSSGL